MVYQDTMDPSVPSAPCPHAFMEEMFEVTSCNETTPEQGGTDLRQQRETFN